MNKKKILLCADSRILFPQVPGAALENFTGIGRPGVEHGMDWSSRLHQLTGGIHEFITHRTGIEHYMLSLFDIPNIIKPFPDKYFDLAILQIGWLENICYWEKGLIKELLGISFKEECLTNPGLNLENNCTEYLYYDLEGEKQIFELIRKKSKSCLGLGFHSIKTWCGLFNKRIKSPIEHHYDALRMNDRYSSYCDYLHMPMDPWWNEHYIGPDRIHYNRFDQNASDFIAPFIARYINRMDKTINNVLKEQNNIFYHKSLSIGKNIANITNRNDIVLLTSSNTNQLTYLFIGCILYGRIPLIIQHPSHKISNEKFEKKIKYIQSQTKAKLCISDDQYIDNYKQILSTVSVKEVNKTSNLNIKPTDPDINDIAFLQLSSGTTNLPKILSITHKNIIAHCDEYAKFVGISDQDTICSWLPLYHDMGLIAGFLLPLLTGSKFIHIDTFEWLSNPRILLEQITQHKATHVWMPNFAFNYMAQHLQNQDLSDIDLSSIKQFISCSELTFIEDIENFANIFMPAGLNVKSLRICYALAENIFAVSQSLGIYYTEYKGLKYLSCGQVLPGVSLIIEKNGKDITTEGNNKYIKTLPGEIIREDDIEIGRILIKSDYTPTGETDFFGYYDTGDYGFMNEGHLYIVGRQKDAFNSCGLNIYPEVIEHEVSKHPAIIPGRVACFGILTNGTYDVNICAETDNADQLIATEIVRNLQDLYNIVCTVHLRPRYFCIKTSSGKISRSATKEKFLNEPVAQARGVTPFCSQKSFKRNK